MNECFPDEVIRIIFGYLSAADAARYGRVCKRWQVHAQTRIQRLFDILFNIDNPVGEWDWKVAAQINYPITFDLVQEKHKVEFL